MRTVRMLAAAGTVALITSLLAVIPAHAVQPQKTTLEFEDEFIDTEICDFDVAVSFVGTLRVTEFYDGAGNLVRVQTKGTDFGTATANGKTASGVDNWLETFDVGTETFTIRGLYVHLNFPAYGVVLIDVGYAEFDGEGVLVQMSGPHQAFEGDFEALCAALA